MDYRRYSLYNAVGAIIWGTGLTFAGFLLGYIPPLADFVIEYIDVILLCAIAIAVVPTAYHAIKQTLKARKAIREGTAGPLSESEAIADIFEADAKK
jgi:membrane-associated protein